MIEGLRRKQVKLQIQREEEILLKIKQKMDRIKANQQKFQPITADIHRDGSYLVLSFLFLSSTLFKFKAHYKRRIFGEVYDLFYVCQTLSPVPISFFLFQYFCCSAKCSILCLLTRPR